MNGNIFLAKLKIRKDVSVKVTSFDSKKYTGLYPFK